MLSHKAMLPLLLPHYSEVKMMPAAPTAINRVPFHATPKRPVVALDVRVVQLMPSGEVSTSAAVPVPNPTEPTATCCAPVHTTALSTVPAAGTILTVDEYAKVAIAAPAPVYVLPVHETPFKE